MAHAEGSVTLELTPKKIVSKKLPVFYNTKMERNRNLTLLLLAAAEKKNMVVADPLAGTGVRGMRLLKELPPGAIKELHLNDMDADAVASIKEHLKLNTIDTKTNNITISCDDANHFLLGLEGCDYIDVDPYGSPNPFLDAALRKCSRGAIIGITATDTAALAGRYPQTCKRRYWSQNFVCSLMHEIGLRILIRRILLVAMEQERVMTPIFSYHEEHYYRVSFKTTRSRTQAAHLFDELNYYAYYNVTDGSYSITQEYDAILASKEHIKVMGPFYGGKLQDSSLLKKMIAKTQHEKTANWLAGLIAENDVEVTGLYDTHILSRLHNNNIIPLENWIHILEKKGYRAVRSSTCPTGIKTDAPFSVVKKIATNS